ncbi:MarR family transcriptional regulator [Nocardioides pantholopis]|uniref:MarR family transcriptional regulator n=1 Tax=Nocardioides pantholopis TaxID=2483798 RepID=UPI001F14CB1D|nr:MarR family transcriptional regulator [Nocardioides pantholopis]
MPSTEKAPHSRAGLASELRLAVMRLRRRLAAERDPGNDLGMNAMAVLAALQPGGLGVGELASIERVKAPTMTRTINHLAEGGYVTRRAHATDGRQVLVEITDLGRETLRADRARRDEWLSSRLRALSADERAVLRQAAPILHRLAQED